MYTLSQPHIFSGTRYQLTKKMKLKMCTANFLSTSPTFLLPYLKQMAPYNILYRKTDKAIESYSDNKEEKASSPKDSRLG